MRILLDENFPLQLYRGLREAGYEHMIALGQRGVPDAEIRRRLAEEEDLVFLTQDTEFEELAADVRAAVIISRIPQAWPIAERFELWLGAIHTFLGSRPPGRVFDLLETGELAPRG